MPRESAIAPLLARYEKVNREDRAKNKKTKKKTTRKNTKKRTKEEEEEEHRGGGELGECG